MTVRLPMRASLETEEKERTWSDRGEAISVRSSSPGLVTVGSSVCGGKPTLRLGSKVRKGA